MTSRCERLPARAPWPCRRVPIYGVFCTTPPRSPRRWSPGLRSAGCPACGTVSRRARGLGIVDAPNGGDGNGRRRSIEIWSRADPQASVRHGAPMRARARPAMASPAPAPSAPEGALPAAPRRGPRSPPAAEAPTSVAGEAREPDRRAVGEDLQRGQKCDEQIATPRSTRAARRGTPAHPVTGKGEGSFMAPCPPSRHPDLPARIDRA